MLRNLTKYDLANEASIVRKQLKQDPNPVVEARNLLSDAVLAHVLLALSDAGFYEYVSHNPSLSRSRIIEELAVNPVVFNALFDHILGARLIKKEGSDYVLTEKGKRMFNVYTRGVLNIYLGGYAEIFYRLSDMLADRLQINDPALERSAHHAAAGTAFATCTFTIPDVYAQLEDQNVHCLMDLGCGTGDFLIQYLRLHPTVKGIGVDMSPEAIEQAKFNADHFGLSERLSFYVSEVGTQALVVPEAELAEVDMVTSMYMMHEFGRDGEAQVINVLQALAQQLPQRKLLLLEVEECDPEVFARGAAPKHFGRLDYLLIHVLSGQGLPRTQQGWHAIFTEAKCDIVQAGIKTGGSYIYIVNFPGKP